MKALRQFIAARRYQPLVWGERDCCLTVADAVMAWSNVDVAHDLRGQYASPFGALRALKRLGFNSVAELIVARLKRVERPVVGGVVMHAEGYLNGLLFVENAARWWGQGERGLECIRWPAAAISFWELG